jgi:DNA invertase Pin-like site-specific DNA recombinase
VKLCAYLRVSTGVQLDGYGLDVQKAEVKAWAKANGHTIPRDAWFIDEGISGSNGLDTRVALADALNAIEGKNVAGMVVPKLDRLSRDMILQETLIRDIRKMGGDVYSTLAYEQENLHDNADEPGRKMVRQILGAVNEYERALIRLRLARGRAYKRSQGGYAGDGSPRFGVKVVEHELVPDEAEMDTAARIRELSASGRSSREIAAQLNSEGRPSKRGGSWSSVTVLRVLARTEQV